MRVKRTVLTAVVVALLTGCGDDLTSVSIRIEYAQALCGDTPVNNAFFENEGTVGVFVLDAAVDNRIITGQCTVVEALPFRAVNDLPRILQEDIALEPLPLEGSARFQVVVYDALTPCEPYQVGNAEIPRYAGLSEVVDLEEPPRIVNVVLGCL